MADGPRVLYLVYWGAAEPLGQSLVLPSVRALARRGSRVTLVSFEKPADLERHDEMARIRDGLAAAGVAWSPLRYHKRPKLPATAFDLLQGAAHGVTLHRRARFDIIHARTFVAGNLGRLLAALLRRPLVYHNEGYYPDEQVDAGVWTETSLLYKLALGLERRLYAGADGLVLLSEKSRQEVLARPEVARRGTRAVVAPSCVDLELFCTPAVRVRTSDEPLRLAYVGNVEGRYRFDQVARFAAIAGRETGGATLRVLTRASPDIVRSKTHEAGLADQNLSIDAVAHAAVPAELQRCDAGLHFLPRGRAEHAGSPTKIGEYWASGLPAVVTPNAGDSDRVIADEGVGVVVAEHSDEAYARAGRALAGLLEDPGLRARCRAAAETHYSLDAAARNQLDLYAAVLAGRRG